MYGYCAPSNTKADLGCSYGKNECPKQLKPVTKKIESGLDSREIRFLIKDYPQ